MIRIHYGKYNAAKSRPTMDEERNDRPSKGDDRRIAEKALLLQRMLGLRLAIN